MAAAKKPRQTSSSEIAKLRDDVHQYHIEVTGSLATMHADSHHFQERLTAIELQINGENPARDNAKGLTAAVQSLEQSRDAQRTGLRWAWGCLVGLGGLFISYLGLRAKMGS